MPAIHLEMTILLSSLEPEGFRQLWKVLGEAPLSIRRYNDVEPIDRKYSPDAHKEAWEMFIMKSSDLLLAQEGYIGSLNSSTSGLATMRLNLLAEPEEMDEKADQLIGLLKSLAPEICILYAGISTLEEFRYKHFEDEDFVGGSFWDLLAYFPGIYWYTWIGKEALDRFEGEIPEGDGKWTLDKMPEGTGIRLRGGIQAHDLVVRTSLEREVAARIEIKWFFDRFLQKGIEFLHPMPFYEYLDELGDTLFFMQRAHDGSEAWISGRSEDQ